MAGFPQSAPHVRDALFREGWNAVQVQKFLGHHKASFTLNTYVPLLDDDLPVPPVAPAPGGIKGATQPTETGRDEHFAAEAV